MGGENSTTTPGDYWKTTDRDTQPPAERLQVVIEGTAQLLGELLARLVRLAVLHEALTGRWPAFQSNASQGLDGDLREILGAQPVVAVLRAGFLAPGPHDATPGRLVDTEGWPPASGWTLASAPVFELKGDARRLVLLVDTFPAVREFRVNEGPHIGVVPLPPVIEAWLLPASCGRFCALPSLLLLPPGCRRGRGRALAGRSPPVASQVGIEGNGDEGIEADAQPLAPFAGLCIEFGRESQRVGHDINP